MKIVPLFALLFAAHIGFAQAWDDRPVVSVPAPLVRSAGQDRSTFLANQASSLNPWQIGGQPSTQTASHLAPANSNDPFTTAWAPPPIYAPPSAEQRQITPVGYPRELQQAPWASDPWDQQRVVQAAESDLPVPVARRGREGLFQRLSFNSTYLPGNDISNLGVTSLDFALTLAFPFPSRDMPLIVTPGFEMHFLEGPTTPDLPARLYDSTLQFRTMTKLGEFWGMDVAVTPGWHSDFETSNDQAFRITGHAFAAYDSSPVLQWIFGVVYLDRSDFSILPAVGLIYKPTENQRIELTFPRPRYLVRLDGWAGCQTETWAYLAGEFGSGTWAIERAAGTQDVITYTDYRIVLGWERKFLDSGQGVKLEAAYVFGRNIEYDSATPDFKPGDTMMVRAGFFY